MEENKDNIELDQDQPDMETELFRAWVAKPEDTRISADEEDAVPIQVPIPGGKEVQVKAVGFSVTRNLQNEPIYMTKLKQDSVTGEKMFVYYIFPNLSNTDEIKAQSLNKILSLVYARMGFEPVDFSESLYSALGELETLDRIRQLKEAGKENKL